LKMGPKKKWLPKFGKEKRFMANNPP